METTREILNERERVAEEIRRDRDPITRGEKIRELSALNRRLALRGWMPEEVKAVALG